MLNDADLAAFRALIYEYYAAHERRFPWRETSDPYAIWVSEIMLQQTQTHRVVPKYEAFLARFPTVSDLAEAPLADLLAQWQGLGYNRRALAMQKAARQIMDEHGGRFPDTYEELLALPGIGAYTASAILAFAFNKATPFIETNIRRVFLHRFFADQERVSDKELMPLVEQAMDREHPRDWYYALMDYGVHLAKSVPNPNRRSKHYAKQSAFEGSNRQVRGRVLKALLAKGPLTLSGLLRETEIVPERMEPVIRQLEQEGFLLHDERGEYRLGSA